MNKDSYKCEKKITNLNCLEVLLSNLTFQGRFFFRMWLTCSNKTWSNMPNFYCLVLNFIKSRRYVKKPSNVTKFKERCTERSFQVRKIKRSEELLLPHYSSKWDLKGSERKFTFLISQIKQSRESGISGTGIRTHDLHLIDSYNI